MLKILIVEHAAVVRAGIREWLSDISDFEIVGEAVTADEGLGMVNAVQPDLVLLDIAMPKKNGYEALIAFKTEKKDLPVLIISSKPEQFYALELMNDGADGYFVKQGTAAELVQAIREIFHDPYDGMGNGKQSAMQENTADFDTDDDRTNPLHERLNAREYEIFYSICRGEKPSETAEKLSLSLTTVNKYRKRVFSKMEVDGIPGLIRYAVNQKIDVFHN